MRNKRASAHSKTILNFKIMTLILATAYIAIGEDMYGNLAKFSEMAIEYAEKHI